MAYKDIDPEVVAEISNMVGETLDNINDDFNSFQQNVLNKIENSWYNENAPKVMPGATQNLTKVNEAINKSLSSLGGALGGAANTWAQANGAGSYFVKSIAEAARNMVCNVQDNKNGRRGMDVDDIQTAINQAESLRSQMIGRLTQLEAAGNREGFRGGNMQAQLNTVCHTLRGQIDSTVNEIIDNITTNTGTAKSNVENATSATESIFTID